MTVDLDALLAQARLPERTVALCLRGDLQAKFEELERQLTATQAKPGEKMTDGGQARKLAEQMETLRGEMADSTVTFTLRALSRSRWAALMAEHPAPDDSNMAVDLDALYPALVRECIVEPEMTGERWKKLDGLLTSGQFEELSDAAMALCRRPVDVPFSPAASRMLATSEQTSRRRPDSGSR